MNGASGRCAEIDFDTCGPTELKRCLDRLARAGNADAEVMDSLHHAVSKWHSLSLAKQCVAIDRTLSDERPLVDGLLLLAGIEMGAERYRQAERTLCEAAHWQACRRGMVVLEVDGHRCTVPRAFDSRFLVIYSNLSVCLTMRREFDQAMEIEARNLEVVTRILGMAHGSLTKNIRQQTQWIIDKRNAKI